MEARSGLRMNRAGRDEHDAAAVEKGQLRRVKARTLRGLQEIVHQRDLAKTRRCGRQRTFEMTVQPLGPTRERRSLEETARRRTRPWDVLAPDEHPSSIGRIVAAPSEVRHEPLDGRSVRTAV